MPSRRPMDNILAFSHTGNPHRSSETEKKARQTRHKLHPAVRRRRLIWLGTMIVIISWSLIELIIQQGRIWEKEEQLAAKKKELQAVQAETQTLKDEIKKLGNEDYLLELAHKLGYSKPGEEIYEIRP
ncbi:FtsB family cell division protein [Lihuaxuella thermophila]|uniref:Cell division protein FtsB n=1 Tax=Lihuaxuella thermophila TaxID=1173111 RepID=A0A1H8I4V2_9BACL|nr:septum formation initiator family protein [Lihuaxuella thermophila]SEN63840.1 Cell division protein FtsB [Lihuaxuella thermophila]